MISSVNRDARELSASIRFLILVFSFSTSTTLIMIAWTYLRRIPGGVTTPSGYITPLYWEIPCAALWILLAPFAYYIAKRNPVLPGRRFHLFSTHAFFAILFACVHLISNILLSGWLYQSAGISFQNTVPWCPWNSSIRLCWRILFYALIVGTFYAIESYDRAKRKHLENRTLALRLQQTRLEQLRMQIDPSFIQRTLSDVLLLIHSNASVAVETITRLGAFFHTIQAGKGHALRHQIRLLRSYFRVESQRTEGRIRASIVTQDRVAGLEVPGFQLQSIVKEFYRLRVGDEIRPYRLQIELVRNKDCLRLKMKDNPNRSGGAQKSTEQLKNFIRQNHLCANRYAIRETKEGVQIQYDLKNRNRMMPHPVAPYKEGRSAILWFTLASLALFYLFIRRTLHFLATGAHWNFAKMIEIHSGLWIVVLSIPFILFLARKIKLRHIDSVFLHTMTAALLAACLVWFEVFLRKPSLAAFSWTLLVSGPGITFPDHFLIYWTVVLLAQAFWNHGRAVEEDTKEKKLQNHLFHAQLRALEMQLHPHFLFNTLHAINGLILTNKIVAERMVRHLKQFLQMTLCSSSKHLVPFTQELQFLECYLEIQKIRFGDRFTVQMDIAPESLNMPVPQLILQPVVENAIRHGLSEKLAGGKIVLLAKRENGALKIAVQDNGPGCSRNDLHSKNQGLGLQNSALRLRHLYGSDQKFSYGNRLNGGFEVQLEIPFRA